MIQESVVAKVMMLELLPGVIPKKHNDDCPKKKSKFPHVIHDMGLHMN